MKNKLVSIPISIYCEKVRWALEYARVPYHEIYHIQGFSWYGALSTSKLQTKQLPVFKNNETIVYDSTRILQHIDKISSQEFMLYPNNPKERKEVEELEDLFDEVLGPSTRMWGYCELFEHKGIVFKYNPYKVPWIQKFLTPYLFSTMVYLLKKVLKITPEKRIKSMQNIDEVVDKIEKRLSDGREFLVGDKLTAADITFASMMTPVLMPSNYGVPIPTVEEFRLETREMMNKYRNRPAGKFALKLFSDHRVF